MHSTAVFRDVRVAAPAGGSKCGTRRGAVRTRAADSRSCRRSIQNTSEIVTVSADVSRFRRLGLAASTAFSAASFAAPALADDVVTAAMSAVDPATAGVGAAALAAAALAAFAWNSVGTGGGGPRPGTAPMLPGATPMSRGDGESDASKNRGYLIAPPPLFPLVPAFARQTYRYEVDRDKMWFFEQKQGIGLGLNVSVNVRMTVIKLKNGGLWVHAPVAPTEECISLLNDLGAPVEHIVLPTTLFEHKIFVGPFARRFPNAQTWIAPDQWSWPVNLPASFFGIFNAKVLGQETLKCWGDEFELELLQPPALGVASFVSFTECAFLHKPSKTLLVTDAVVYVSENVPDAIPDADLLESGDDNNFTIGALKFLNLFDIKTKARERTVSSDSMSLAEKLRLGWQRNALQALYFGPNNLLDPEASWGAVTNKLIVAPVVSTLVYENIPLEVTDWARRVGRWNFTRIVPCHFDAPIKAGPKEWTAAFGFLPSSRPEQGRKKNGNTYYPDEDMVLLRGVEDFLQGSGVIFTDELRPKYGRINVRAEERRSAKR